MTAGGGHNARQRQGQGRFGDWGALSPGHPHTAGRETGHDAAAQAEAVAGRTADAMASAGTEGGRGAVEDSRADQASVEGVFIRRAPGIRQDGGSGSLRGEPGQVPRTVSAKLSLCGVMGWTLRADDEACVLDRQLCVQRHNLVLELFLDERGH